MPGYDNNDVCFGAVGDDLKAFKAFPLSAIDSAFKAFPLSAIDSAVRAEPSRSGVTLAAPRHNRGSLIQAHI
jgi:hypothetical protein